MRLNYDNFCRVLAEIEADPSCWNQASMFTTCFIGIAARLEGCTSYSEAERYTAGIVFLGVNEPCPTLGDCTHNLDHFRRIRLVGGYARLRAN